MNVNSGNGNDTIVGENMIWLQDGSPTIAFNTINSGAGEDYISLYRSAAINVSSGNDNDTVIMELTGGGNVNMGAGNDVTRIGGAPDETVSDSEVYQKYGQNPLALDGSFGADTLNLQGDWTLTLSSGNVTIDTDGDGIGDLVTNVYASSQANKVIGFPAVLNGTVSWGTVTINNPNATHETLTIANDVTFRNYETIKAVCFTAGTMIETTEGLVAIETLRQGDLVLTRNGPQPVRWIGKRRLDSVDLGGNPKMLPIRVPAGAFGNGLPKRDVTFSPQHRVLIRSSIAERMFGSQEVLVPVKQLIGVNGIEVAGDVREVQYIHVMFEEHQLVEVEGIEAESLYPGQQALSFLGEDQLNELREIFPNFDEMARNDYPSVDSIPFLKGRETRSLAARHVKNGRPLYS
ncbi:MAG: Hint domain-containing protein [Paracoccus sp. (in: a-proteobacteria)]